MANKVRVKWHIKNWRALRNSPEVRADLDQRASRIAAAAGDGFTRRQAKTGKNRARASVGASSYKGRKRQSEDNVLQQALNAGRG